MAAWASSWWHIWRAHAKLASEANAIVQGAAFELFARQFDEVPAWVLVNAAAHGDLPRIRSLALSAPPSLAVASDGRAVACLIAREVYTRVGEDGRLLAALQTAALIPLEIELLELPPARISATTLIVAVREELRSLRSGTPEDSTDR